MTDKISKRITLSAIMITLAGQLGNIPTPIIYIISTFMILLTIIALIFVKEPVIKNKKVF